MIETLSNVILYLLIGMELFINMPMNGVYRLPGSFWTKDTVIMVGGLLTFIFAFIMTRQLPLSLPISIVLIILYFVYVKLSYKPFTISK